MVFGCNFGSNVDILAVMSYHHEQVNVGIRSGSAVRIGTEQHDSLRAIFPDDLFSETLNLVVRNHDEWGFAERQSNPYSSRTYFRQPGRRLGQLDGSRIAARLVAFATQIGFRTS